jgi:exodeoxyribonuclease VII large subunit
LLFLFCAKIIVLEAHKLSEVNKYIQQVIALNFEDSIWVKAELSQVKFSGRHVYIELIENDERTNEVIASVSAVIWFQALNFIRNKYGESADQILQEGNQIQCKVKIDFHQKYGLKFIIQDIDPSYTFGQLELERQQTIEKLRKAGLLGKNKSIQLPKVLQRIAVISSEKAAGLQDFIKQLNDNSYGYQFKTEIFHSAVQGVKLVPDMIRNLNEIAKISNDFDCVVIIRGGGSKLDLAGFDDYELTKTVAGYQLPVLTGIGHDIDQNVIELVTNTPLKTPTAVANFILDYNLQFEREVQELNITISTIAGIFVKDAHQSCDHKFQMIQFEAGQSILNIKSKVSNLFNNLYYLADLSIQKNKHNIDNMQQAIRLSDPKEILKKGYSLSYQNGQIIKRAQDIAMNKKIDLLFEDGRIKANPEEYIKSN